MKVLKSLFLPALIACAASAAGAQPIGQGDLRRHIEVLASDEFEGRKPGTAGGERTEAYLIEAFAKAGLQPGTENGTWRQTLRIATRTPIGGMIAWSARNGPLRIPPDQMIVLGREERTSLRSMPVVFGGYGTAAELQGVDLSGTLLLRLGGDAPADRITAEQLLDRGVAAVVDVAPDKVPWSDAREGWSRSAANVRADRALAAQGLISAQAAGEIARAAGADLTSWREAAMRAGPKARRLGITANIDAQSDIRRIETANIIGKIPGTSRPDEAVVLLSHWDHLGICAPEGAPDRICNGAVDNASGTAILIETAGRLAAGLRPGRTIYILATTAEEMGLMGAAAFADAPPVPAPGIVAALNLDTTAIGPAGLPVAIIGRGEYPALEAVVDATARRLGRRVDPDREANVMLTRQDGWAFAGRGIPAIMATGSVSDMGGLRDYLAGVYHGPSDDLAHLTELGGAAEDANLHVALARALADPAQYQPPRR